MRPSRQGLVPPLKHCVYRAGVPRSGYGSVREQYEQWDKQSMSHAIKAVVEEGMSIRRAALRYGIPKSTLGDRISGRVLPGCTSGPPKILTEDARKQFLASIWYGKT